MYLEAKFRLATGNATIDSHALVVRIDADGDITSSDLVAVTDVADDGRAGLALSAEPTGAQAETICQLTEALEAWHAHEGTSAELFARIPIKEPGTDFQRAVRKSLRGVGEGETLTYAELAQAGGKPAAARAAATVCSSNKAIFVVPCHRVVPAAGGVGQYARGGELKEALLEFERAGN